MHAPTLTYPFREAPAGIDMVDVAAGVHWLRLALPWALDHINLWLLDDDDGITIVDTGLGDEATRAVWGQLLDSLARPVRRIIATHYHPDHMGNAEWLSQRTGAPVSMAYGEFLLAHAVHGQTSGYDVGSMLVHFCRHGLDPERLDRLAARGNVYQRGVPELPASFHRLAAGERITINGCAWDVIIGQGHSPEHVSLHCAELGVLIAGDMLLPRITPNISVSAAMPEEDSVGRFLASLQRFEPLPAQTLVLPAHGLPFYGVHGRIGQLAAHHAERDATILRTLQLPHTAVELLPVLFRRELDSHQLMFALGEAIAHLNHLWLKNCLRRIEDGSGTIRFHA
jgi:glyoxylase-like metal-dependent hydrolase (beta-lactamase superfamily II)